MGRSALIGLGSEKFGIHWSWVGRHSLVGGSGQVGIHWFWERACRHLLVGGGQVGI